MFVSQETQPWSRGTDCCTDWIWIRPSDFSSHLVSTTTAAPPRLHKNSFFPCPQVIRITVVFHLQPPRFLPPHHSPPKLRLMAAHGCSYLIHNTAGRLLQGCGGSRAAAQPADAGPIAKLSHKWLLVITHRSTLRNGEMTFQLQSNSKLHSIFCNRPKTISSFHSLPSDSYLSLPCPLSLGNISFPFSSAAQVSGNVCAVWFSLVFQ